MEETQTFESSFELPKPENALKRMTRAEETAGHRRRRAPGAAYNGAFLRLGVDTTQDDPNYVYHWFNDDKGRLQYFTEQDDWDFVTNGAADNRNLNESDTRVRRIVGRDQAGQPLYAYRCRKLREWYDSDQQERIRQAQEQYDRALHTQTGSADEIDAGDLKTSYIPREVQAAIRATDGRAAIRRSRQQHLQKG